MPRDEQAGPSTPLRVVGFLGALALVFGLALVVGGAAGPIGADAGAGAGHAGAGHAGDSHGDEDRPSGEGAPAGAAAVGLEATQAGYTLRLDQDRLASGRVRLAFRVLDPTGSPVTAYDEEHERDLHLVVVRRDLTGFQHVHPRLAADGTWSVPVDLRPGVWRVIADTRPAGGEPLVLGTDLLVGGAFRPAGLGLDRREAEVAPYDVRLDGEAVAGEETVLTTTVRRDGEPVTDLQPYLGAYGHLVALRAGDLGYLHVHPEETGPGPEIGFATTFPSPGRYRLFLDFRHGGEVRTAPFTVTVAPGGTSDTDHSGETGEESSHDH